MKFRIIPTYLFAMFLVSSSLLLTSAAPVKGDYDWLKNRLEVTKAFTLEVIKAMPDDKYNYSPGEGIRTYKALAHHVIYSIDYYNRMFKGNPQPQWNPGDENGKSKTELVAWAEAQFDAINATILTSAGNDQLTAGVISYLDHNAHHRGNMVTYLRMNKITPPSYR